MVKLAIIDVDRTVADTTHRDHLVDCETPDWEGYTNPLLVRQDGLVAGAGKGIDLLRRHGFETIFLTGRSERLRKATHGWMESHGLYDWGDYSPDPVLIMRPDGNDQVPSLLKQDGLIKIYREYRPDLVFAFDDDWYMFPVYEKFGAITFKAPECWSSLFPVAPRLPPEPVWRK